MKIDYGTLFPLELPDEVAYYLVDFLYNLATRFDGMHLEPVMRHEKAIVDGKVKPKPKPKPIQHGVKS